MTIEREPKKRVALVKRDWYFILPTLKIERDRLMNISVTSRAKLVLDETDGNRLEWAGDQARWAKLDRIIREIERNL